MRRDNELLQAAVVTEYGTVTYRSSHQDTQNRQRLQAWRERRLAKLGVYPNKLTTPSTTSHSNANVLKFPRYHGQFKHAQLPLAPDTAA